MSPASRSGLQLVGDVGGTNARFALADITGPTPRLFACESFLCADYPGVEQAIDHYLRGASAQGARPRAAAIAVAGPVTGGAAALTNGAWRVSEAALIDAGFSSARVINDYTALALSVRHLEPQDLGAIGATPPTAAEETVVVLGAGTGLGVSAAVRDGRSEAIATTEGGHIAFAPGDEIEIEILRQLTTQFGRVSLERLLSGPGLVNLRAALARIDGREPEPLTPEAIVTRATAGEDALCVESLDRFCAIYGAAAGDIALVYGARGGVYLGGGIAANIVDWLRQSAFRRRFEAKGRFVGYLEPIATQVILHPFAALLGAAQSLQPGRDASSLAMAADVP
ncbi:glucokinase [Phenylobacterium hankyongense]|uniref:Glucokinase n=1 Tax=Phenylobacterium hankyongense TaxID=1813876 RepID=A0A328AUP7_9CAUL|nr:glucokinase [Phenylobacterium hankyongense]RAK58329.1 glucokinase [Phenylobacterium hankyongense]